MWQQSNKDGAGNIFSGDSPSAKCCIALSSGDKVFLLGRKPVNIQDVLKGR